MDYTVVSIVPLEIRETKNTLKPVEYHIPETDGKEPKVLHIQDIKEALFIPDRGTSIDVQKDPKEVAEAIVRDYRNATWLNGDNIGPGLFCVPGLHDAEDIAELFPNELARARRQQHDWLWALVKQADDDWFKFHQHKMIAPIQMKAARLVDITREWTVEPLNISMVDCPHCLSRIPAAASVCRVCTRDVA